MLRHPQNGSRKPPNQDLRRDPLAKVLLTRRSSMDLVSRRLGGNVLGKKKAMENLLLSVWSLTPITPTSRILLNPEPPATVSLLSALKKQARMLKRQLPPPVQRPTSSLPSLPTSSVVWAQPQRDQELRMQKGLQPQPQRRQS